MGGYCEADSECGTLNLNNCNPGGWDIYQIMVGAMFVVRNYLLAKAPHTPHPTRA